MALNLVQQRGGASVWDRTEMRVDAERWLASMVAGGLVMAGVRTRSTAGWLMVAAGAVMAWWALSSPGTRRWRRGQLRAVWSRDRATDRVGEASEESFPASDAPSWTPTTGTGPTEIR